MKGINIKSIFIFAVMAFALLLPGYISAGSNNRLMIMSYDAYEGNPTTYGVEESTSGGYYYWDWIKQVSPASDPYLVLSGGNRIMALLNNGTVLTKDSTYANWVTQTTGVSWIAIGANSEMMIINSAGNVYSKKGGLYDSWVQQTSGGGAWDIAVGGNGRMMVIDSAGNAYSKESTYDTWVKQVDGAYGITLGPNGQMGVINNARNAYSKLDPLGPWVQQTSGGGTKMLVIGGNGRMMVIDSANNAYSKESTYEAWIKQVDGAKCVGVGSSGRMVVINSNWDVYYKDSPTAEWILTSPLNSPRTDNYWVTIN